MSFAVVVGLIVLLGWFASGLYLHDIHQVRGQLPSTKITGSPYYLALALLAATVILASALFALGILLFEIGRASCRERVEISVVDVLVRSNQSVREEHLAVQH